jgi:hypothetical protein
LSSEKTGIKSKTKNDIINNFNQKENKIQISYEYEVGDQVFLEIPGILRKSSTPRTGPNSITNVYKKVIIRIQNDTKELYQKE